MKIIREPEKVNDSVVIERAFITEEGYYGVCVFTSMGFRCGYVGLPEDHQLYGMEYDEIDHLIMVHGGITFSGHQIMYDHSRELWFFGFDCGHSGDEQDVVAGQEYGLSTVYISPISGTIRTLDYVIEEVKSLSKQLTPQAIMRTKIENS